MLLSKRVRIGRVISGSWKYFLIDLFICSLVYLIYLYSGVVWHIPPLLPTILGTALAFFIGFNNNQAYDRWWEARKVWGALVNDSRTWARQLLYFSDSASKNVGRLEVNMIKRHVAFLYALKAGLRGGSPDILRSYLDESEYVKVVADTNKANAVLNIQAEDLNTLYKSGLIDGFQFMQMNQMLINFCDGMGKSERIAKTVFPTTYNYYTRFFIWIFIICATMVAADNIAGWSIFFGSMIGYVFLTIHHIGESLLNPFEELPTGVPLNLITRTIEINLLEMLKEEDVPEQIQSVNGEYIL